jgi:hypothetical protein
MDEGKNVTRQHTCCALDQAHRLYRWDFASRSRRDKAQTPSLMHCQRYTSSKNARKGIQILTNVGIILRACLHPSSFV